VTKGATSVLKELAGRLRIRNGATPVLLSTVLLVGVAVRLYRLEEVPPGLYCDEVAIALNAESIGRTGRDLSGTPLPLYIEEKSFQSLHGRQIVYQPIYTYAAIPFVLGLGRSPSAVRLTSVCFGLAALVGTYLLGRHLLGRTAGLLATAFLALGPWHVHFSRIAFEAISLPAMLIFGAWLLLRGLQRPEALVGGTVLLAAATYAYPVAKLFVPLFLGGFGILYRKILWEHRRTTVWALALGGMVALPNAILVMSGRQQERVHQVLILSGDLSEERAMAFLRAREDRPWARAILEKRELQVPFVFAYNYLDYFSAGYLFFEGDANLRHNSRFGGMYYRALVPFILAGAFTTFRRRREPAFKFLMFWLAVYPVPAALTLQSPHAIRSMTAFPAFELLAALGAVSLAQGASRLKDPAARVYWPPYLSALGLMIGGVGTPVEAAVYLRHYHRRYPVDSAPAWQAGIGAAVRAAEELKSGYKSVVLSPRLANPFLDVIFFAGIAVESVPVGEDLNRRLQAHRYRIAHPAETPGAQPDELWIVTSEERRAHPNVDVLRAFPFADGRPNLFMVRGKR
jgi:4-amino-4-deoxy-L-arabinose transferase-like glycosyltransferase